MIGIFCIKRSQRKINFFLSALSRSVRNCFFWFRCHRILFMFSSFIFFKSKIYLLRTPRCFMRTVLRSSRRMLHILSLCRCSSDFFLRLSFWFLWHIIPEIHIIRTVLSIVIRILFVLFFLVIIFAPVCRKLNQHSKKCKSCTQSQTIRNIRQSA